MTEYKLPVKGTKSAHLTPLSKLPAIIHGASCESRSAGDKVKDTHLPRIGLIAAAMPIIGGHSVQACALIEGLTNGGYKVRYIAINPRFPVGLGWLRRIPYLRTALNQLLYMQSLTTLRHVDVIHVFSASYWSFLLGPVPAMVVGRLLGKRVLLHYHSGEADDHLTHWGELVHPWLRLAHKIVVPSEYLKEVFEHHGYETQVIQNIVDASSFRYRKREPLQPRILSTRNFETHYRVDVTIKAFSLILRHYPDATLTLAGVGSEETNLRRLAASLAPNAIEFVGRVDPKDMPKLCNESDIFVNASVVDNQPVSILEAFASGLPVVTTAIGGIASMVCDGESGLLVRPGDSEAIANAVITLLNDPQYATQIASKARDEVEKYKWVKVRDEWDTVYSTSEKKRKNG